MRSPQAEAAIGEELTVGEGGRRDYSRAVTGHRKEEQYALQAQHHRRDATSMPTHEKSGRSSTGIGMAFLPSQSNSTLLVNLAGNRTKYQSTSLADNSRSARNLL